MSRNSDARRPAVAALMSLLLPGLGQLYLAQPERAIWLFLGFVFCGISTTALVSMLLPDSMMMTGLVVSLSATLALWLFAVVDAWRGARAATDFIPARWQSAATYTLVAFVFGGLVLPMATGFVRTVLVQSFRLPSTSMQPGVLQGDYVFVDKRYNCPGCGSAVARGDVVVFVSPNDRTRYYIKRVIGLPGDRVQVRGQRLLLNGTPLAEPAAADAGGVSYERSGDRRWPVQWSAGAAQASAAGAANGVGTGTGSASGAVKGSDVDLTVPSGQIFLLGDNRGLSEDSRSFGTVPLPDVIGRARQVWFSHGPEGIRWSRLGASL